MISYDTAIETLRIGANFDRLRNHTIWMQQAFARDFKANQILVEGYWLGYSELVHEILFNYCGEDELNPPERNDLESEMDDHEYLQLKEWIQDVFIRNYLDRYIVL